MRAKEAELISSPDNEFRFHSGHPVGLVAGAGNKKAPRFLLLKAGRCFVLIYELK